MAKVSEPAKRPYTVKLYFTEHNLDAAPGERTFNLSLQEESKLQDFDILSEAGGARHLLVKEFQDVPISSRLKIQLEQTGKLPPVLSGVELKLQE
ncbi:MAG: malectin domain-containing carbohydrate-binding protein [Planctomycetaceae bacterium]